MFPFLPHSTAPSNNMPIYLPAHMHVCLVMMAHHLILRNTTHGSTYSVAKDEWMMVAGGRSAVARVTVGARSSGSLLSAEAQGRGDSVTSVIGDRAIG